MIARSLCAWCVCLQAREKHFFFLFIISVESILAQVFLPYDFTHVGGFHDVTVLFWRWPLLELCLVFNYVFNLKVCCKYVAHEIALRAS